MGAVVDDREAVGLAGDEGDGVGAGGGERRAGAAGAQADGYSWLEPP